MTKTRKGYSTLAEHDAEMKANGTYDAYVELGRKKDEEHAQRVEALRIALIPLEEDLRAAGAPSRSAMSSQTKPPDVYKAIPILLAHAAGAQTPHASLTGRGRRRRGNVGNFDDTNRAMHSSAHCFAVESLPV